MYNDDPLYGNEGHTHSLLRSEEIADGKPHTHTHARE